MIKAEVITHEGTPGPNWLDRCKDVFTPQVVTTLVVILFAVLVGVFYNQRHTSLSHGINSPGASSQQTGLSAGSTPRLQVLQNTSTTVDSSSSGTISSSSLQPANNAGDAALPGTVATNSTTTGSSSSTPSAIGPADTASGNALQQTVQGAQNDLNNTLKSLVPSL